MPIHADREIAANKPDIRDYTNQKCQIIDMAVPSDRLRNISVKGVEKLFKYKDLEIEIA